MLRADMVGAAVVWTIDRPEAKNALDLTTIADLTDAIRGMGTARVAIITGAGDTFVSGGDLRELRGKDSRADAEMLSDKGYALTTAIARAPFPVIAALNGPAIGGGAELAVACDLRIAAPTARIAFKQVRMGVTTSWGTAGRLRELVGAGAAARLLFTAQEVSAKKAKTMGLVDRVEDDAVAAAREWADEIAKAPSTAIAATKKLLRAETTELRARERELFVETWSSDEHRAAVERWFDGRRRS
ncbi:MAG: enoyl-CoA hydratase/isomerase family protein [Labilithrix sp.]|nr:enoyl-CoA hydratase/isomerase family protein [Labilithrix sp.]MCW5814519.1 enoyl-CoA hydratase/isomerase family protein [Labilithrix sp.]